MLRRASLLLLALLAGGACGSSTEPASPGGEGGAQAGAGGSAGAGKGGASGKGGAPGAGGATGAGGAGGLAAPDAAAGGAAGYPGDAPPADAAPEAAPDLAADGPRPGALIVLVAGGATDQDGIPATQAELLNPFGVAVDPVNGDVYLVEADGNRVRRVDGQGKIATVIGPGAAGPGGQVKLSAPHDLLFQPGTRNLFVADTMANRVVRLNAETGQVAAFAGAGTQVAADLMRNAFCVDFDPGGQHLLVVDGGGERVLSVDLTTMAVTRIPVPRVRAIAMDAAKNLYVAAGGAKAAVLQRLDPAGKLADVIGTLNAPKRLAIDPDGNVVIADTEANLIRRYVVATHTLERVAGLGTTAPGTLGGAPDRAGVSRPHGVFVDRGGRIYIADSFNNRVLRVE